MAACCSRPVPPSPSAYPASRCDAVDTNGAGDTHTGVFIAALAHGADALEAARRANAAAAYPSPVPDPPPPRPPPS